MYREFAVAPQFAGVLEALWLRGGPDVAASGAPAAHRILPDGCTDLIWVDGELLVAGPDTRAHLSMVAPAASYAAVRFAPGAGPTVFGVPGRELRDQRVPLRSLWPAREVRRLAAQVGAAADRPRALQTAVAGRLADTGPPDPVAAATAAGQRSGNSVATTAAAVGLSERQLHRRCLFAFGYGAKTLSRVLRFRRAVAQARAGASFAEVAARAGYADQAHLARDVRALSGVPLGELVTPARTSG